MRFTKQLTKSGIVALFHMVAITVSYVGIALDSFKQSRMHVLQSSCMSGIGSVKDIWLWMDAKEDRIYTEVRCAATEGEELWAANLTSEKNFCILLEKEVKIQDVQGQWKTMCCRTQFRLGICVECVKQRETT